eukprot:3922839-Prymnesium_polylepis.3
MNVARSRPAVDRSSVTIMSSTIVPMRVVRPSVRTWKTEESASDLVAPSASMVALSDASQQLPAGGAPKSGLVTS